jgi:integrase
MPKLNLTDLAVQRLKPGTSQTRYFDEATPGFGILVGKKTKTFFVVTGKERRMQTLGAYPSVSLKDARSEAKRILADPTAQKAATGYSKAVDAFEKARTGHVKAATLKRYRFYLDTLAFKGDLRNITRATIKEALARWDGKPRAMNACHSALRTFLNWCVEQELLDRNPLYRARSPNKTNSRARVLTDDEIIKIWNATDYKPYGYIIRLCLLTAARKNEARHATIESDMLVFKDTKNGTDHHLPLTPLIREHVMEPYQFNNWQRSKEALDKKCGIAGYTVHDCRRTWAYLAGRLGIRPEVIERVLNHKRTGIVEVYQRYEYHKEMSEALHTVESFIVKLVAAEYNK